MSPKKQYPFGLWPSPISARVASQRNHLNDVQWDGSGKTLLVHEGRGDRGVLMACPMDEARRDLTDENNVRGGVGYGGGEFNIRGEAVVFAEKNGRLYKTSLKGGQTYPITPPFGKSASPAISPDGSRMVYVFSDGHTDLIGMGDTQGKDWPIQLARGADFYMQPVWSKDGQQLAWIEWDHPNMPWDGTRLKLGRLDEKGSRLIKEQTIAGNMNQAVCQPLFSPDGRWLSYITSNGEWEDLVLYDLTSESHHVLFHGTERMLSEPAWVQGGRSYGWHHSAQKIYNIQNAHGRAQLWEIPLDGSPHLLDMAPYTWMSQLTVSPQRDEFAFIGSAPDIADRVVVWNSQKMVVMARSDSENLEKETFSRPEEISWQAQDSTRVYGWFYPPNNPECSAEGLPPCIVYVHGGPTSSSGLTYNSQRAYFTSRGYAWLEVNYRGSTGYGSRYTRALNGHWGDVDTEDAGSAALALRDLGLADPQRLAIMGGSAGGYLVLNTLIRYPGRYKAAICSYGVSNLFSLAMDTHKFEAHYNDSLVGKLPEAAGLYHAWSPIYHAASIKDPIAIFQGNEDVVVPPSQSEEIVEALRTQRTPYLYKLFEGEGHGFRKPETLNDFYLQVERFLRQYVLFAPARE